VAQCARAEKAVPGPSQNPKIPVHSTLKVSGPRSQVLGRETRH